MLIHLEFPIADLRSFSGIARLARPGFPDPQTDLEFFRGSGVVRNRLSGGLSGWIAENPYCDARRSFRIDIGDLRRRKLLPQHLDVEFRRLYFDGTTVGKFDVGFGTRLKIPVTGDRLTSLLSALMTAPVRIRSYAVPSVIARATLWARGLFRIRTPMKFVVRPLIASGFALAAFYVWASTKNGKLANLTAVSAGSPAVFIQALSTELSRADLPPYAVAIGLTTDGLELFHWWHECLGRQIHVWACIANPQILGSVQDARNFRLYLLRLNAENQAFAQVLRAVAERKIVPNARDDESDRFQSYLNETTKRILDLEAKTQQFATNNQVLAKVAAAADIAISPEERDGIRERLKQLDLRKNIYNKANGRIGPAAPDDEHAAPPRPPFVIQIFSNISLHIHWSIHMPPLSKQTAAWVAFIFGVIYLSIILVINLAIPNPTPFQYQTFRIVLALAAAGVGGFIPGILQVDVAPSAKIAIHAAGALALFVIIYFFSPGLPPH
jgi:hypothetical protein